ncbi:Hypothetical_protein [Hexamita inflata]|uniref:Hypothetical_protein n=1 Tax=Hexamita inflata TaxID=28002 RepID=A0AA86QMI8_9EUKA|nr:Hypothetical protein HINF_LOCUS44272 [Hexamita inflata]
MFYYSQFDSSMIIKRNGGQNKCQRNDLTQFSGQNFTKIRIDGRTKYQQKLCKTEFVLKSCNSVIDKVEVYYCQINLDEAAGNFRHIVFKNCTFSGRLSDKFNAESLKFFCGIQLYSLSAGYVKEINIISDKQDNGVDFTNVNKMKNLNKIQFKNTSVNLSQLNGTWKYVSMANCDLREQISNNLQVEYFQISNYAQNILSMFVNYEFIHVCLTLRSQKELSFLKQIKWQSINLTLYYTTIDLELLSGHYDTFKAIYCTVLNNFSAQFSCNKMILIRIMTKDSISVHKQYNTQILLEIHCEQLYIIGDADVDYLPANIRELYLYSCKIRLRNTLLNLETMKLMYCTRFQIRTSQVPSLKQLSVSEYCADKKLLQFKYGITKRQDINQQKYSLLIAIQPVIQENNTKLHSIQKQRILFYNMNVFKLHSGYE